MYFSAAHLPETGHWYRLVEYRSRGITPDTKELHAWSLFMWSMWPIKPLTLLSNACANQIVNFLFLSRQNSIPGNGSSTGLFTKK